MAKSYRRSGGHLGKLQPLGVRKSAFEALKNEQENMAERPEKITQRTDRRTTSFIMGKPSLHSILFFW